MAEPVQAAAAGSGAGEAPGAGAVAAPPDTAEGKALPTATGAHVPALPRIFRFLASLARFEDWLLALFVVFAAPLIVHTGRSTGGDLFGPGDPFQGTLRLAAVLAALVCAAARVRDVRPGIRVASFFGTAAVGPFTGAVLLVGASGATALSLTGTAVEAYAAAAVVLIVLARFALPPLSPVVRRALVTPFILVAGGLFWTAIDAVFAGPLVSGGAGSLTVATLQSLVTSPAFLFLLAFSGVYYAMLVYAPRQVADPEGGVLAWAIRYAMFLAGVVLGVGWLRTLGG